MLGGGGEVGLVCSDDRSEEKRRRPEKNSEETWLIDAIWHPVSLGSPSFGITISTDHPPFMQIDTHFPFHFAITPSVRALDPAMEPGPGPNDVSGNNHAMLASTTASNEAFAEHLLARMGFVLPASLDSGVVNEGQVDELMRNHHSRSNAELQVEKAVLEMGKRLRDAEDELRTLKTDGIAQGDHMEERDSGTPVPQECPTCHRSSRDPLPITPMNHLTISRTAPADDVDSPMSAETELELLKAQVQDIARVCKAVALGDLTQKIIVPVKGQEMIELKGESPPRARVWFCGKWDEGADDEQRLSIIWWISCRRLRWRWNGYPPR